MSNATTTATTQTAQVTSSPNVHYTTGEVTGQNYPVTPHEPSPR
jgi:hypothetical protein